MGEIFTSDIKTSFIYIFGNNKMTFTKNIKIAQTRQRFQGTCYNISKSKQFVTQTLERCVEK